MNSIMEISHRTLSESGPYRAMNLEGLDQATALGLFRQMLRLRRTEEALHAEYHPADEMRCPIHFCIGQEATPAALSLLIQDDDYLFSHHRSHGYYFAKGSPMRELFAEIYGKATGANGGKAGSQDISHSGTRFYSGAILAGAVSIAVGAAFGIANQGQKLISVAACGEGATDEGAFWEAINYAGSKKLPVLFIIENNRYATFSDQLDRQASDNICERVAAFGIRTNKIFGNDAPWAWRAFQEEFSGIRNGSGPCLIECYTYRWNSHVGPEDDAANAYRTEQEMAFWKTNCPIALLRDKLLEKNWLDSETESHLEKSIQDEIESHFAFAKSSPFPVVEDWHDANFDDSTPLADKLLITRQSGDFDPSQAEAKLGPY